MQSAATALGALVVVGFVLAACGGAPSPRSPENRTNNSGDMPGGNAATRKGAVAPPGSEARKPGLARQEPPAPRRADPSELLGLAAGAVTKRLGIPDFAWRESMAELWQYRARLCVFDLFLYRDEGGVLRVRHLEARASEDAGAQPGPGRCLAEVLDKGAPPSRRPG